jgi:hypothetical protein
MVERDLARWAGIALIVIAGVLFYLHPSTSYGGYSNTEHVTTFSTGCVSPFNEWTQHFDSNHPATEVQLANLAYANAACQRAITERAHYGWAAGILGVLLVAGSFLPFGRRAEPSGGTWVGTYHPQ